jgi:hypothetical protein
MSTQVQKAHHPFSIFCLNLFGLGSSPARSDTLKHPVITLADLTAMPKDTQLLLAHSLDRNNPDLTLLNIDTDARKLVSVGWLVSEEEETIGSVRFRIKHPIWHQLRSLRKQFITNDMESDLASYRKRKSALYPWIW